MLFFMVLLANLSAFAQNSMVGDGFGGRAGYSPVNYSSTEQGGFSICGANNQLYGWGYNLYNQLPPAASGYYDASTVAISNMTNVRQAKGALFHMAIKKDGTGWVWGSYTNGLDFPTPTQVITNAYYGDAGYVHAAFVKTDGTVWTVGANANGVYGDGTTTTTCLGPTPCAVQMPGITNAKRVSCGRDGYTLILLADGTVKQVGKINNSSSFPMPPSIDTIVPVTVPGLSNIVDVKAGPRNALALTASGQVYSWGYNYYTGLGLNNSGNSMPTLLTFPAGAKPIKAISNGKDYGLALDEDGKVYGWGNIYGPGINTTALILTPTLSTTGVQDIIGGYSHSYIVKTDGTMWASGYKYIWMNLTDVARTVFTQITPTGSPMNLCAPTAFNGMPPCVAGTTAPAVTPTTATNTCPATTVNLASLAVSSTTPSGASLIWSTHKTPTSAADTLTTAQKTAVSTAGTYYALYYDATNACYSPADSVVLSISTCLSAINPAAQTATTGQAKTGNAATELAPTGGVSPYIYSDGTGDAACVAPSGATALTGLTVNSSGSYSYTAPTTAGTYYYCIKVCDSSTPTADCVVKTYTLTVSVPPCNVNGITPTFIKN